MIADLFPEGVVTVESTAAHSVDALRPEEEACLGRSVEKRRREFAAGRACARRALASLGLQDVTIPAGPDRLPLWPPGIVGSITHCDGYCAAAVATSGHIVGLGLDAESIVALEDSLVTLVCLPSETEAVRALHGFTPGEGAKLAFSAKEAAYKCYFPFVHHILEFHDVEVTFTFEGPRRGAFVARVLRGPLPPSGVSRFQGRFARDDVRVYAGVTLLAKP
ncbi:MAG: 4'-phosphopantetheinyl transferase superfamily protein [Planctomycetes bacterium]|nr:4'-phosphopantetheinyl transferase superfamily protein [Planctomycetota bacterium]